MYSKKNLQKRDYNDIFYRFWLSFTALDDYDKC